MPVTDISEVLKAKFLGKPIKHSTGATLADGQVLQKCPCPPDNCCDILYEFGYEDLVFDKLNVTYGDSRRSSLPAEVVRRRWILENGTDVPDKKNLSFELVFTEQILAGVTRTVTQGRTATFNSSANFDLKLFGKYSFGYTEAINLSVGDGSSKTETKTKIQTERYDLGYDIPARTAAIIDLTKEIVSYTTKFSASFVLDGYFAIIYTVLKKNFRQRQSMDKRWGKISDYLSESDRSIVIEGELVETAGETTRRSIRFEPITPRIGGDAELLNLPNFPIPRLLLAASGATESSSATIMLLGLTAYPDGQFDVTFGISTGACKHSSCSGFDATIVLERNGARYSKLYSFGGWAIAEGDGSYFTITRSGIEPGLLVDVINIESPTISCDD